MAAAAAVGAAKTAHRSGGVGATPKRGGPGVLRLGRAVCEPDFAKSGVTPQVIDMPPG